MFTVFPLEKHYIRTQFLSFNLYFNTWKYKHRIYKEILYLEISRSLIIIVIIYIYYYCYHSYYHVNYYCHHHDHYYFGYYYYYYHYYKYCYFTHYYNCYYNCWKIKKKSLLPENILGMVIPWLPIYKLCLSAKYVSSFVTNKHPKRPNWSVLSFVCDLIWPQGSL